MLFPPHCLVADKDYIYSVSYEHWEEEWYILVSRVHLSEALDQQVKWSIISVKTLDEFGGYGSSVAQYLEATCTMSKSGVLYLHTMQDSSPKIFSLDINNVRGKGDDEDSDYDRTCKRSVGIRRNWISENVYMPRFAMHKDHLIINNEDTQKPDVVILYSYLEEQVLRLTMPQIHVLHIASRYFQRDPYMLPTPVTLANTIGAIHDMAYGDKMLFALIRERNGSSDTAWTHTKKTLVYLRLETPYDANDIKKSIVSIPWDDECTNEILSSSGISAAANGKFYYICAPSERYAGYVRLYIHDTRTNSTNSYRYSTTVRSSSKFALMHMSGSTDGDPEYIFCEGLSSFPMYLRLPTSTTMPGTTLDHSYGSESPSRQDFEELCDFSRLGIKEYAGIAAGVLVFLFYMGIIMKKRARRRREAALKRTEQAGLPGYEESMARDTATSSQGGDAIELNAMGSAPVSEPETNDELPQYTRPM
ncbi:hypothetical protein BGZ94_000458 [Podila epigama]|nr:hypothetical protein BGZ94_000458 [Podila epigama]